jgi:proteasome lid subunit RPN8/RPN11
VKAEVWRRVTEIVERAYPREGCGWIAGEQVNEVAGGDERGFEMGDAAVVAMARVRGEVVVFHSHPDGMERLSARDLAGLSGPQLVIAVAGGRARAAALWRVAGGAAEMVERYEREGETWTAR